jgi:hypothetical protein
MRWAFALVLLCSCATPRQQEASQSAKPVPKLYPPAITHKQALPVQRSVLHHAHEAAKAQALTDPTARAKPCPACNPIVRTDTVYLAASEPLDSLQRELQIEQLANQAIRKRLGQAEGERDYWQEKNEQKFWALVAMGVFGFLYILFTLLASRIKES